MRPQDDPLLRDLRRLATPSVDPRYAEQVRQLATNALAAAPASRSASWRRPVASTLLALGVAVCFCWSICFILAAHL